MVVKKEFERGNKKNNRSHTLIYELPITQVGVKGFFQCFWWSVCVYLFIELMMRCVFLLIVLLLRRIWFIIGVVIRHLKGHSRGLAMFSPSSERNEKDHQNGHDQNYNKYMTEGISSWLFVNYIQFEGWTFIIISQCLSVRLSDWDLYVSSKIEVMRNLRNRYIDPYFVLIALKFDAFL